MRTPYSRRRKTKEEHILEVVFEAGTHAVETEHGKATVVIPRSISIESLLPALKALAKSAA